MFIIQALKKIPRFLLKLHSLQNFENRKTLNYAQKVHSV
jgi:hypothetical protein